MDDNSLFPKLAGLASQSQSPNVDVVSAVMRSVRKAAHADTNVAPCGAAEFRVLGYACAACLAVAFLSLIVLGIGYLYASPQETPEIRALLAYLPQVLYK